MKICSFSNHKGVRLRLYKNRASQEMPFGLFWGFVISEDSCRVVVIFIVDTICLFVYF